jgi:hypothetical protein
MSLLARGHRRRHEVRLHPLDRVLDGALLLGVAGIVQLRVKAHLGGEPPEGRVPARRPAGVERLTDLPADFGLDQTVERIKASLPLP